MAKTKSTLAPQEISDILRVTKGVFDVCLVGTSPLILNRMSEKAKHELLMPKGRKNATERTLTLKHVPVEEYRASAYTIRDASQPTYLAHLSTAFKKSLTTAALDMPGARKAQIGRLTYIDGEFVGVYGVPKLFMAIVRSADMSKTPDVRTRAILPEWACRFQVTFVQPLIRAQAIANLLAAAGITIGVGDWRSEKGSGSYGQFRLADKDDPDFARIMKTGGRAAQIAAMEHYTCYDDETVELLSWYDQERAARQLKGVA